jgi:broad specificity phosphatase PhoE
MFITQIKAQHAGQTVVVFSHGGMIRHLLAWCGVEREQITKGPIKNAHPIVLVKRGQTYGIIEV